MNNTSYVSKISKKKKIGIAASVRIAIATSATVAIVTLSHGSHSEKNAPSN